MREFLRGNRGCRRGLWLLMRSPASWSDMLQTAPRRNSTEQCDYKPVNIGSNMSEEQHLLTFNIISNSQNHSQNLPTCLSNFRALTLLVGQQEGHPACKNWMVRYWHGYLSGAKCKWSANGPADATAIPSSLAPVKSRMVSGAGLPRLSCKKGR